MLWFLALAMNIPHEITDYCYFDIAVNNETIGRLIFGLYGKAVPKTVNNFLSIMEESRGSGIFGRHMQYKNTLFYSNYKGYLIIGGDFNFQNGSGSESIYGFRFKDENYSVKFDRKGVFGMVNNGKNTNGCTFFITYKRLPGFNGKKVGFGQILEGWGVLSYMERLGSESGKSKLNITIAACGRLNNYTYDPGL